MNGTIRWGILGTGRIAHTFAKDLPYAPGAELAAVGSRTQAAADAFGEEFGIARRHGSYQSLAADPDVDAIYVSTPHSRHMEDAIGCLRAGKAVLCEKPFAINARQATAMASVAREEKRFLMEAMWSRFLPLAGKLRTLVQEGAIGEVRMLSADFGFRAELDPKGRLFDLALGGGGLLDVGIYPISLAFMIFGAPSRVTGLAHIGETGADEQCAVLLGYEKGQIAITSCAVRTNTPHEVVVMGTEGQIRVHAPWWRGSMMTIHRGGVQEQLELLYEGTGYHFEAEEVMRCMREGKLESPLMPLDETVAIMRVLDEARAQWGLRYPDE